MADVDLWTFIFIVALVVAVCIWIVDRLGLEPRFSRVAKGILVLVGLAGIAQRLGLI